MDMKDKKNIRKTIEIPDTCPKLFNAILKKAIPTKTPMIKNIFIKTDALIGISILAELGVKLIFTDFIIFINIVIMEIIR